MLDFWQAIAGKKAKMPHCLLNNWKSILEMKKIVVELVSKYLSRSASLNFLFPFSFVTDLHEKNMALS